MCKCCLEARIPIGAASGAALPKRFTKTRVKEPIHAFSEPLLFVRPLPGLRFFGEVPKPLGPKPLHAPIGS